jgi:proliferating cell nuclear antigen PCNA
MNILIQQPQKAEQFSMLFQHIKLFTDHINMMFEKDQLFIQCMDGARVAIMELRIPSTWFDAYSHSSESTITIGASSSMLFKILSSREKTQQMEILYSLEDSDKLCIHQTSENTSEFDKRFEIPLMEIDSETMDIPVKDHQAEITLSASHFASIVSQLKMFGDTMEIQCSEEKIMLVSNSQNQGKMFVEIRIEDVTSFAIEEGEQLELSYSLAYLHNMCLYHKLTKEIELKFSKDFPMQLVYPLGMDGASLSFYLAPKIDD